MKSKVPFYSQYDDVTLSDWKSRSCTIVCLKMALEFFSKEAVPTSDELIKEGLFIGAHSSVGWSHQGVSLVAHNHGVPAYLEEFKNKHIDFSKAHVRDGNHGSFFDSYGIEKIKRELGKGNLVTVSVLRNLVQGGSFHTILLTGFEEGEGEIGGFYFHDPDTSLQKRENAFIPTPEFIKIWRRFAIFIGDKLG
jgi:hypothetical protein